MTKIIYFFLVFINCLAYSQPSDFKSYYIIGDKVNIRGDTSLNSRVDFQAVFGEEFLAKKLNKDWYYLLDYEEEPVYVSSKFITGPKNFLKLAEARTKKNSPTLLSLLKIYKNSSQLTKAENLSIDIINNNRNHKYPNIKDNCPLLGEAAFNALVQRVEKNADNQGPYNLNYCKRVIRESKDSFVTVRVMNYLANAYISLKRYKEAKTLLIECLKDYGNYIILSANCAADDNSGRTYFIDDLKDSLMKYPQPHNISNELYKICYDNKMGLLQKSIACDVLARLKF